MKAIILLVDQWLIACTMVRTENLRVSGRMGLLFGPNHNFLFLSSQQLLSFQSCFCFSWGHRWASLASFPKLSFREITLLTMTEVWRLLVPLMVALLAEMSARWFPLASRGSSLECPGILIAILECEVKWALERITTKKASGGDGIPVELFQILEDDAVKVLHSICQQIRKTQQWPQDWKRSVFIPIPNKGNAKETFKLLHNWTLLTC